MSAAEQSYLAARQAEHGSDSGYAAIQSTRPDTLSRKACQPMRRQARFPLPVTRRRKIRGRICRPQIDHADRGTAPRTLQGRGRHRRPARRRGKREEADWPQILAWYDDLVVPGERHRWHAVRGHLHGLRGDLPAAAAYAEPARRATDVAERDHLVSQAPTRAPEL
jgi:hypothetical protein